MSKAIVYQMKKGDYCHIDQVTEGEKIEGPFTLIILKEEDQKESPGPSQKN